MFFFFEFSKLYLKVLGPHYRTIYTISPIREEECIMCIPHSCILTSDIAKCSRIGQAILRKVTIK